MKSIRKGIIILFIFTCLFSNILALTSKPVNFRENDISPNLIVMADAIEITISSSEDVLEDGSYIVGSELTFEVKNDGYNTVNIELEGKDSGRFFNLSLKSGVNEFTYKWDTNDPNPTKNDDPVDADNYDLTLYIDGAEKDCDPSEIVITGEEEEFPLIYIVLIVIIIAAGLGITSLLVIKKKRAAKANDLEFKSVDKTKKPKKKSTIYKGASAIGKQSGKMAESKIKTMEKETPKKTTEKHKPTTRPAPKPQVMMPAMGDFVTKTSVGAAMMKDMEQKLDLDSKIKFTSSKIESFLQNIEFFKAILSNLEQERLACPDCSRTMSKYWVSCPFCLIQEHDSELGLKLATISLSDDVRFCPNCKRIIKSNWVECPFCYVKNK